MSKHPNLILITAIAFLILVFHDFSMATENSQKWRFGSNLECHDAPALAEDGTVYASVYERDTSSYALYAIYPDGAEKWRFPSDHSFCAPTLGSDGTIYVVSSSNKLYALDPDGTEKWRFDDASFYSGAEPALGSDGTIYVAWGDHFFAFSPAGRKKWDLWLHGSQFINTPSVGPDGTIYAGSDSGTVYAISLDGTEKWQFDAGGPYEAFVRSAPAIATDGTLYIGSGDGNLYAVNPDGTEKWHFQTGEFISASPVIGSDGIIYVGSDKIYAISPEGKEKWHFGEDLNIFGAAAVGSDGYLYTAVNGALYALRPDGKEAWHFDTDTDVYSAVAIDSNGTVYIGSSQSLYAINTSSGGLAAAPWPMAYRNPAHTSLQKRNVMADLNRDNSVTLSDTILAMHLLSESMPPSETRSYQVWEIDVNNDGQVGIQESIYALQLIGGLRPRHDCVPDWPLETGVGTVFEYRRTNQEGTSWTSTLEIMGTVALNGRTYLQMRHSNYEPGIVENFCIRIADSEIYVWTGTEEVLMWQAGPVGTAWTFGDQMTKIRAINSITVPYGGPYQAYVLESYVPAENSPCWYEYYIPGAGCIREVSHWEENAPVIQELQNSESP